MTNYIMCDVAIPIFPIYDKKLKPWAWGELIKKFILMLSYHFQNNFIETLKYKLLIIVLLGD